jgi:putative PIN family toxin of toxin-antitoxin system
MRPSSAPKLRAVVDTNLFVSGAISESGNPRILLRRWLNNDFDLVVTDAQIQEIVDVFGRTWLRARYDVPEIDLETFLGVVAATPRALPVQELPVTVRDADDTAILAAAIGGSADCLVTGDADLLVLADDARLGPLVILTATAFLRVLDERAFAPVGEEPPEGGGASEGNTTGG